MREHFGRNVEFGQLHKVYGRIRTDNWYGSGQVLEQSHTSKSADLTFRAFLLPILNALICL